MELSKRLKELRQKRNLTQKELSEKANIRQCQLSKYESGQMLSADAIIKLTKALEVSADYFLGLIEKEKEILFFTFCI